MEILCFESGEVKTTHCCLWAGQVGCFMYCCSHCSNKVFINESYLTSIILDTCDILSSAKHTQKNHKRIDHFIQYARVDPQMLMLQKKHKSPSFKWSTSNYETIFSNKIVWINISINSQTSYSCFFWALVLSTCIIKKCFHSDCLIKTRSSSICWTNLQRDQTLRLWLTSVASR